MFGDRPAAGLMTCAIESAQESYKEVQKLGIFDPQLVEHDSLKLARDFKVDDKKSCTTCKKSGHTMDNCVQRFKGNIVASVSEVEVCPVYNESLHKFNVTLKDNSIKEITGKRLLNCNQFYGADDNKKREIFQNVKTKYAKLCKICTG